MSFTVKYAAPETIKAFRRGDETVKVHPAVDVWAFGVICFELLTNQKFYGGAAQRATLWRSWTVTGRCRWKRV